uniref:Uncharacterized protein n=1 Tax=Avena sativa TaxID=4498 RepID=A0ACD5WWL7_AVESA
MFCLIRVVQMTILFVHSSISGSDRTGLSSRRQNQSKSCVYRVPLAGTRTFIARTHGHCSLCSGERSNRPVCVFRYQQVPGVAEEQEEPGIAASASSRNQELKDADAAMLTEAMFQGYDVLDTYGPLEQIGAQLEVSGSYTLAFPIVRRTIGSNLQVRTALQTLQTTAAQMNEFFAFLTGCQTYRMFRSPYNCYLYIDNFIFGRRVERQHVMNILMEDSDPLRAPTLLPIIGGCRVGKKTLVWSVCSDERVRSHFPCIIHVNGCEMQTVDHYRFTPVRTLVIVEIQSDVDDKEWYKFHSLLRTLTGAGSKVVIISHLEKLARFGTVNLVRIDNFSQEEYSYLFKVLSFGSSDPVDHPRLVLIGKELATMMKGSLVHLNVYSSMLRDNLNVQFWNRVLKLYRAMMEAHLSTFGEHLRALLDKGCTVDITEFSSASSSSTRFMLLVGGKDSSRSGVYTLQIWTTFYNINLDLLVLVKISDPCKKGTNLLCEN